MTADVVPNQTPDSLARVALLTLTSVETAEARFSLYMKEFVDDLSRPGNQHPQIILRMIKDEPAELPSATLNAFLAGVAEFIAQRHDLDVPQWALSESRFLPRPIFWGIRPQTRAHMLAQTPGPFRRRNLFCGYVWLRSNRWDEQPSGNLLVDE